MSNSEYPFCRLQVYSLRRLFSAIKSNSLTENTLSAAGRIAISTATPNSNARYYLADTGGHVLLPVNFNETVTAQEHETWCLTFDRNNLQMRHDGFAEVLKITSAERLTPALRELPWSMGNPKFIADWGNFLNVVKTHLRELGLVEVMTPSLVRNAGMEPELEPFRVPVDQKSGGEKSIFLLTSPELHLKQMLAAGFTDIFEVKTVYRKEELTAIHEPEFHMLEWYRGYSNLDKIAADLKSLLHAAAGLPANEIRDTTIAELFEVTGFRLTPTTTQGELHSLAKKLLLHPSESMDWNDLFHLIWVAKVESELPKGALFVRDYPPSQAALARLNSNGWADRLEFYWQGVEIANAFHELNDPVLQRERFQRDQKKRIEYGRTPLEIDENFMSALEYGMPPSGGIALGLDRLFMLTKGASELKATRAFSYSHQFRW